MKKMILLALLSAPAIHAAEVDQLEICVTSGPCAIRVQPKDFSEVLYLVRSDADFDELSGYWEGVTFAKVSPADYDIARSVINAETLVLPAVNPNDGWRSVTPSRPAPRPNPGAGGPLVSFSAGNISIGSSGGGGNCAGECHTGSWKDIHAQVLKPKTEISGK